MIYASYHHGHESTIAIYDTRTGIATNIELEKVTGKRYVRDINVDRQDFHVTKYLLDRHFQSSRWMVDTLVLHHKQKPAIVGAWAMGRLFYNRYKTFTERVNHHIGHAALGYYTSPFNKAIVITADGGGDGLTFSISAADDRSKPLRKIKQNGWVNLGGLYQTIAAFCTEVNNTNNWLTYSGKAMALCSLGQVDPKLYNAIEKFFYSKVDYRAGLLTWPYRQVALVEQHRDLVEAIGSVTVSGQRSYDLMASCQKFLEDEFKRRTDDIIKQHPGYDIVISGGVALNVLNNEVVKQRYPDRKVFVPSAPGDNGLALGFILADVKPEFQVDCTFSGIEPIDWVTPTLGDSGSSEYRYAYEWLKCDYDNIKLFESACTVSQGVGDYLPNVSPREIAQMLADGKIVGVMNGPNEFGPRALGARSILCDPSYPEMKDRINKSIKGREWYRPFAPICKLEAAATYFDSSDFEFMNHMSFAPKVKEEWRDKIPSVVHYDGTARLQTITKKQNQYVYEILTEFENICGRQVLLNTSFNVRGKAIINEVREARLVLQNTDIDAIVVQGKLLKETLPVI